MRNKAILTLMILATVVAAGCSGSDDPTDPCGGRTDVTGTYASTSPAMTMSVMQCGAEVDGSVTIEGETIPLARGEVNGEMFSFASESIDLCATQGIKRVVFSNRLNEFVVEPGGSRYEGSLRVNDTSCSAARTHSRGFTTRFVRQ